MPDSTRPRAGEPASPSARLLAFAAIAVVAAAARLPFLLRADRFFDADEAVEGLMARHVLAGEHPLFLWGQRYKGVPEVYLSAAVFHAASPSVVAMKAVTLACFIVFLCLNFLLLERVCSRRVAWIATAFFIAGPPSLVLWTLSGSAEIVMTWIAGTVLLLAVDRWRRTGSRRAVLLASAALGFGLWIQQYILYYVVSLVATAAIVTPGSVAAAREAIRTNAPAWLRTIVVALALAAVVYIVLGSIAFFASGVHLSVAGVSVTATHPQKMWWIAGTLTAIALGILCAAIFRAQLIAPGLALAIGYAPAIVGRIGNHGMGAPIARLDFEMLRAAWPDVTGVMLPMLFGWRDPSGRPTVFPLLVVMLVAIVAVSYREMWRRQVTPFFHVFPVVAAAMFFVSGSYIDAQSYRYLMPIYAALPVVYAIGVEGVWRVSRAAAAALLAIALLTFAAQQRQWYLRLTPDLETRGTIACLDASDIRRLRAGYWQSYTLTFLTGERIIVSPTDGVDRYPPYSEQTRNAPTLDSVLLRCRP